MANEIKLKRGSGSDPTASDLVVGEIAIRTDTGKLFTKKDDNSVAEISGGGIEDGDKGDITVSSSGATFTIDNDAVTYAKIQNVSATNRILGRDSSGAGVIEEITPANLRTMLNVEDGATADQSASEILTLIKTVDGSGSGLDADTLDGISSASFLRSDQEDSSSAPLNINGGTADASNDATLFVTATNNNDWGLLVDKFNGSATEYGIRVDVGSSANLAFQIRGNDSEVFRINGSGQVILSGTVDGRDVAADGTKLDGIASGATNVTNNNQLTNGAGYIDGSALNASNLSSGTIPDARFPATLPAISGANLTNLPSSSDNTKMPLSGGEFTGDITTHDVIPDGNNTRDLGSSSNRFANLFVNDMHFANSPENVNKVDGTWGDWTLQEGEDSVFMLNNRNGKKYKMNLTEIV